MQIKCADCKKKQACFWCKFFFHLLDILNQTEYRDKIIFLARNLFLFYPYKLRELDRVRTAYEHNQCWIEFE